MAGVPLIGKQPQKGTGVFFPPCLQEIISDLPAADSSSSSGGTSAGCGLLFSSAQQHVISAQWPEAVRGPAVGARPGATAPKRPQPVTSCAGPRSKTGRVNSTSPTRRQQQRRTSQTEARHTVSSSLGLPQATRSSSTSTSSTSIDSSSCCSSPALAAAHAADVGLWGAASITAQSRQPAGSQSSQPRVIAPLAPAMPDGLALAAAEVWPDECGGLPAAMWFDVVQHDSMQLQAESPEHSLSWASNNNLMLLPAVALDASGLSPVSDTSSSSITTTHGGQAARPRRSSLLAQPPHSPPADAPAFSEPIAVPCLASSSGSLLHDQGGGLFACSWAQPSASVAGPAPPQPLPLSLLEQQLLLVQGASASDMAPGTSGLDFVAPDLLAASSGRLVLPLGQQALPPVAVPAQAAGMLAGGPAAAAQSKLRQLAMIEEMQRALEQELLDMLTV